MTKPADDDVDPVHGAVTTAAGLKASARVDEDATAEGSRDETHDSLDVHTGTLVNPDAHVAFHKAHPPPTESSPPRASTDDDPTAGVVEPPSAVGKSDKPKPGDKDYDPLDKSKK